MSENDNEKEQSEKDLNETEQVQEDVKAEDTEITDSAEVVSENNEEIIESSNDKEALESLSGIHNNKPKFIERFLSNLVDTAVNVVVSVILVYLVEFILKNTIGLYFTNRIAMIFIFFVVISILLSPIIESSKKGNTIGKKLSGLKTIKIK